MKKLLSIIGLVIGLYFVVRAAAEPFVVDYANPATYRNDWGGPSLAGVLAVHVGPGVVAAAVIVTAVVRYRSSRRRRSVGQ